MHAILIHLHHEFISAMEGTQLLYIISTLMPLVCTLPVEVPLMPMPGHKPFPCLSKINAEGLAVVLRGGAQRVPIGLDANVVIACCSRPTVIISLLCLDRPADLVSRVRLLVEVGVVVVLNEGGDSSDSMQVVLVRAETSGGRDCVEIHAPPGWREDLEVVEPFLFVDWTGVGADTV